MKKVCVKRKKSFIFIIHQITNIISVVLLYFQENCKHQSLNGADKPLKPHFHHSYKLQFSESMNSIEQRALLQLGRSRLLPKHLYFNLRCYHMQGARGVNLFTRWAKLLIVQQNVATSWQAATNTQTSSNPNNHT